MLLTLLAANDRQVICRIQLAGEGRWVSLALSLGDLASGSRLLAGAERFLYEMAGVDEAARNYGLSNWQGGVISGARYAFRALKAPLQRVCLHELRGQLSSGDVWAVSAAAALAVARLLDRPSEFPLDLDGWAMEEEIRRPSAADSISPNAKTVDTQLEPPPDNAENGSQISGKTSTNGGAKDIPVEPGAGVDRSHE